MKTCVRVVERQTGATVFERGKRRNVIVRLEPSGVVGFRLKGMHTTYTLDAGALYHAAVKAQARADEKANGKGRRRR